MPVKKPVKCVFLAKGKENWYCFHYVGGRTQEISNKSFFLMQNFIAKFYA